MHSKRSDEKGTEIRKASKHCLEGPGEEDEGTEDKNVKERSQENNGYLLPGEEKTALIVENHCVRVELKPARIKSVAQTYYTVL